MTTTPATPIAAARPPGEARRLGPLLGTLAGTDHKRVALLLLGVSFAFFCLGGLLALVMRLQLATPDATVVNQSTYDQLFTMHGSIMVYLFVTPAALALCVYLVPLQIGAPDLRLPRAALAGTWLVLLGGLVMCSGFLTSGGAAQASWIGVDPLSDAAHAPGAGTDLWVAGVFGAALGELLLGVSILATVIVSRTPQMSLFRMPFFTWTAAVTAIMVVTGFPPLLLAMGLLWLDRHGVGVLSAPDGPVSYLHLFWFYGHPVVYIMFFPFLGAVAEVVAVHAGRRYFGYVAGVFGLVGFTALSMGVWGHHMFATGVSPNQFFALLSILLVVPAGIEYFDLVGTLIGGRIRLTAAMIFALGFILQFLVGGLTGIVVAAPTLNYAATDTYFVVAHFHYTLLAGSVFGMFAGLYHWFPKATGRMLSERIGRWHALLFVIGANLTFLPMFFLGADGMRRRVATWEPRAGWEPLNVAASVGSLFIAASVALFAVNVVVSLRRGAPAGDDPWGGHTLEWWTSSPPPRHNFTRRALPPVRTYAPLLDLREAAEDRRAAVGAGAP